MALNSGAYVPYTRHCISRVVTSISIVVSSMNSFVLLNRIKGPRLD